MNLSQVVPSIVMISLVWSARHRDDGHLKLNEGEALEVSEKQSAKKSKREARNDRVPDASDSILYNVFALSALPFVLIITPIVLVVTYFSELIVSFFTREKKKDEPQPKI